VSSVAVDDIAGGFLAAQHLVRLGHRSIAYVSGPQHIAQVTDRRQGALNALKAAGLPESALIDIPGDHLSVEAGRLAGVRLANLSPRPTAVFCANDLLALGVLQALFAADIRVPEDLAIIGYDDIEFAAAAAVPLTSVRQPARMMGELAAEILLANDTPETIVLQPELIVRRSTQA
jgi:LacI family transcriptional regulator